MSKVTVNSVIKEQFPNNPDKEVKFVIVDEHGINLYFKDNTMMSLVVPERQLIIRIVDNGDEIEKRI
jgi:hypothetical protein